MLPPVIKRSTLILPCIFELAGIIPIAPEPLASDFMVKVPLFTIVTLLPNVKVLFDAILDTEPADNVSVAVPLAGPLITALVPLAITRPLKVIVPLAKLIVGVVTVALLNVTWPTFVPLAAKGIAVLDLRPINTAIDEVGPAGAEPPLLNGLKFAAKAKSVDEVLTQS